MKILRRVKEGDSWTGAIISWEYYNSEYVRTFKVNVYIGICSFAFEVNSVWRKKDMRMR